MDAKNYEYLKNKVERYNNLIVFKENLEETQFSLVNDRNISILVDGGNDLNEKLPFGIQLNEHEELMREIKDNLIDAIGMKIVEIEDKMKEL